MIHFKQTHGVRFGLSDFVGGPCRTLPDLILVLQSLPIRPTKIILSHIQILSSNLRDDEFEQKMRSYHLHPAINEYLDKFTASQQTKVKLFGEMPLYLVGEILRQYGDSQLPDQDVENVMPKLLEAIMIANDICNEVMIDATANLVDVEHYAKFALRELLFNNADQLRYTIGRAFLIYHGLKERCRAEFPDDFFDLDDFFTRHFSLTLSAYFHSLFTVYSYWGHQTFERFDSKYNVISPDILFPDPTVRTLINTGLKRFSQTWQASQRLPPNIKNQDLRSYLLELFELRKLPLLQIREGYLCGSLNFTLRKYWDGPYYEVIDSSASREEKDLFFRYLGRTTEMYVQGFLKHAFRSAFKKLKAKDGTPISDAVVALNPKWFLIFEVKAKRPTRDMVSGDQAPASLRAVSQMIFEGLQQLDKRIQDLYESGFKGRVTPILVTGGYFPINEFFWKHYFSKVETLEMFKNPNIDWPQLMDLEDVEVLTALKGKTSITECLRQKLSDSWKKEAFRNFLHTEYFTSKGLNEPYNDLAKSIYDDRMSAMIRETFPNEAHRIKPDASWKKSFDLD